MGTADAEVGPVFIVGAPRSGTTLLRAMLAANPGISIPPESHFVSYLYKRYAGKLNRWTPAHSRELARDIISDAHFRQWGLDPDRTMESVLAKNPRTFADTVAEFFSTYAAEEGKERWGDKTPHYVFFHRELLHLFPDLRFIHLVRDGRDVACSHLALAREQGGRLGAKSAAGAAAWWKASVRAGREAAKTLASRYLEVKYEDLVDAPEATLREICAFARLEYDGRMLRYQEHVRLPRESPYGRPFERVQRPLQGRARDWRSELTDSDVADFEAVAGSELAAYGYPLAGAKKSEMSRQLVRVRGALFMSRRNASIFVRHIGHRYAPRLVRLRNRLRRGLSARIRTRRPSSSSYLA